MPLPFFGFDPLEMLFSGFDIVILALSGQTTGVTGATSVLTKTAHGFTVDQQLRYISGTGFTGLTAGGIVFVVTADANTFSVSATKGGAPITVGTSSAGVFERVIVFAAEEVNEGGEQSFEPLKLPGSDHILHTVRNPVKEQGETFTFPTVEVRRLLEVFDGKKYGRKVGTAEIYEPDIDDVAGKVALKSEIFACEVVREGDMKVGGATHARANLRIISTKGSLITWTSEATV